MWRVVENRLTPVLLVRFTFAFACLKNAQKIITPVMQATDNQIDMPQDDLMSFFAIFCNRPRSGRASDEQRRTFLKVYQSDQSNFRELSGRPVENSQTLEDTRGILS